MILESDEFVFPAHARPIGGFQSLLNTLTRRAIMNQLSYSEPSLSDLALLTIKKYAVYMPTPYGTYENTSVIERKLIILTLNSQLIT